MKLGGDGGKDEMTTCISKGAVETSTCICSARFDSSEVFIEFVIGFENDAFACFSFVPLTVSMGDTCICIFDDSTCIGCEGTINCCSLKIGEQTFCPFEALLCIVEFFCESFTVTVAMVEETSELSVGMVIDVTIWRGQWGRGDMVGSHS
jgi:hypothetical protein